MTIFRIISFPMHGAVELLAGLAALLAPFALGFGPAGLLASVAIGALVVWLAVSTLDEGRGALALSAHLGFDRLLAGLALTAAVWLSASDAPAAAFLAALGVAQLLISSLTRYSRGG